MGLEKDTCVEMVQEYISKMALEDKSIEWLMMTRDELIRVVADCERSARDIRTYVITEFDGVEGSSELVNERKEKLVKAIELQADMVKVFVKGLGDEIEKRLDK